MFSHALLLAIVIALGFVLDTCCCRPFSLRLAGCMISGRDMSVVVVCSLQIFLMSLILFLVVWSRRWRQRMLDGIFASTVLLSKSDSLRLSFYVGVLFRTQGWPFVLRTWYHRVGILCLSFVLAFVFRLAWMIPLVASIPFLLSLNDWRGIAMWMSCLDGIDWHRLSCWSLLTDRKH